MINMVTRTYYFPAQPISHDALNLIIDSIGCSIGDIRHVAETIAVPITTQPENIEKIQHILKMYDLM